MSLDWLYAPLERLDHALEAGFDADGIVVLLLVAALLGLRHASDPDHLVAVTALVAGGEPDLAQATRLGAWWGAGHACSLLALGIPLALSRAVLPQALQSGLERAVGVVILALGIRLLLRLRRHAPVSARRTDRASFSVGTLHGLAGTGAVVAMLIAELPVAAALASLAVFAPMTLVSMSCCTRGYAWMLSRPAGIWLNEAAGPVLGVGTVAFGVMYLLAA